MKTQEQYKSELTRVASGLGITGDHVDVITSLLGYALYTSGIEKLNYTKELSLIGSTHINSKLQRALDRNYSVHRGECLEVEIPVLVRSDISYSVGDLIFQSPEFNLYALESITAKASPQQIDQDGKFIESVRTLKLKVSKDKVTLKKSPDKTDYYIDILDSNMENPIIVTKNHTAISVTRNFRDHVEGKAQLYNLTLPDFGCRLFRSDINNNLFNGTSEPLEITYYKYFDDIETLSSKLKFLKLPNVDIVRGTYKNKEFGPKIIERIPRETAKDIEAHAMTAYFTNSMIRSNTDFSDIFSYLPGMGIKSTVYKWEGSSLVIYILPDSETRTYSQTDLNNIKDQFLEKARLAYYIVPSLEVKLAQKIVVKADIEVYTYLHSQDVSQKSITDILSNYSRRLNTDINIDQIRSEISKIQNVNYSTVQLSIPGKQWSDRLQYVKPEYYFQIDPIITIKSSESAYN